MTLFMYENAADDSTFVYGSTAKTGFPSSNLQHKFITKKWVVTCGTGTVVFAGSTKTEVNSVCLAGYDWTSQPSTLKLEMNATTDFSSPTTTLDLASLWTQNPSTIGNRAIILKKFTTAEFKCFRLKVGHGSSWYLGKIFIGPYFSPTHERLAAAEKQSFVDQSLVAKTVDGQEHVDELSGYRERGFKFLIQSEAQFQEFQRLWNEVGIHEDIFISFSTAYSDYTWYGKFTKNPTISLVPPNKYEINFQFKESL